MRRGVVGGVHELVERVTGVRPEGCPWRAFYDDEAVAVLRAFAWFDKGQAREWWGDDPPAWLVEATDRYRAALEAVRSDVLEQDRRDRERARAAQAPPGWEVEGGGRG